MRTEDTVMAAAPPLGWAAVRGPSMVPTLHDGDRLLVRYGVEVRPGDVVVAKHPFQQDLLVVKRAVEWRGATGRTEGRGAVGRRGRRLPAWPGGSRAQRGAPRRSRDGGWWLLGDNPCVTNDSREFGTVPEELVLGRVLARYRPRAGYSSAVAWLFASVRPLRPAVDRSLSLRLRAR